MSGIIPKHNAHKLQHELDQSGLHIAAEEWISFSIISAGFAALCCFPLAFIFLHDLPIAFAISPALFLMLALLLLKIPAYLKRKRAEEIEAGLLLAIPQIAAQMRLGSPFEEIIGNAANSAPGELGGEFRRMANCMNCGGMPPDEALMIFSREVDSEFVRRAAMQLVFEYRNGNGGDGLSNLGKELAVFMRTRAKSFSSKMAVWGLVFIAISCIVPALFAAYLIIGSAFLALSFTENDIYFAFGLLFPLLDAGVLLYIKEKTPAIISY
ncbi:MAG: type II secretion system F family protein [Candidatus Micrarchaeota archaeon]